MYSWWHQEWQYLLEEFPNTVSPFQGMNDNVWELARGLDSMHAWMHVQVSYTQNRHIKFFPRWTQDIHGVLSFALNSACKNSNSVLTLHVTRIIHIQYVSSSLLHAPYEQIACCASHGLICKVESLRSLCFFPLHWDRYTYSFLLSDVNVWTGKCLEKHFDLNTLALLMYLGGKIYRCMHWTAKLIRTKIISAFLHLYLCCTHAHTDLKKLQ